MNLKYVNLLDSKIRKHSPEALLVAGVIGVVVTTVKACKATTKLHDILEDTNKEIDLIHEASNDETLSEKYTKEDVKKDLTIVYTQTAVKIAKLYAPSLALGVLSVACILTSNNLIKQRNLALISAYSTLDKGYKSYRKRVVEKYGEEVDQEMKHGLKVKTVEKTVVDGETGKEKKVKSKEKVVNKESLNDYTLLFDKNCKDYMSGSPTHNEYFLRCQEKHANYLFKARGYLFLNDVLDMIGAPRTQEGQIVGWVYDHDDSSKNHISFGITPCYVEEFDDVLDSQEFILDFNVQGVIIDKI